MILSESIESKPRRIIRRVALVAAALATPIAVASAATPVGYVYQPLSLSGYSAAEVFGVSGGYAVGYGYSNTDSSYHALAWNLSNGTSFRLDETGLNNAYARGATGNLAVGYANSYDAYTWNLSTGQRMKLASSGASLATGAGGGYAFGSDYEFRSGGSGSYPVVWNLATGTKTDLMASFGDQSTVTGVSGNTAVGWRQAGADNGTQNAVLWNLNTGTRTSLSSAYSRATGAANGYAVGIAGTNPYDAAPVEWNLTTQTQTALNISGLYGNNSGVNGAGNGLAFGYGNGDMTNYATHAMIWDLTTNVRTDLQADYMPANRSSSTIQAIDEQNGTMVGQSPTSVSGLFALVGIDATTPASVAAGATATVGTNYTQSGGTAQLDGIFRFTGSANTYTLASGTLKGTGTVQGFLVNTGGTVAPGDSPGTLTITSSFLQAAGGTLSIDLGVSSFDVLKIGGSAFLNGALQVQALTGLTLTPGDTWDILSLTGTGGTISGAFSSVTSGYQFSTINGGKTGRLTFVGPVTVPEANTGLLLLLAGAPVVLGALVRRRHR